MSLLPDFDWKLKYTPEDGDLVGCTLDQPEVDAIEHGQALRDAVQAHIGSMPLLPETPEAKHALELLAWMVAKRTLEVKVALPCGADRKPARSNAIFHEKAGIVEDRAGYRLAWNGSLNETVYGWQENWESINIFRSWDGDEQRVNAEDANFARIWAGHSSRLLTVDVPTALRDDLFRFMPKDDSPARMKALEDSALPEREVRDGTEIVKEERAEPISDEERRTADAPSY